MGVIYSQVQFNIEITDGPNAASSKDLLSITVSNERLRLDLAKVTKIVRNNMKFKFPPVLDYVGLHGFFQTCADKDEQDLVYILWKVLNVKSICYLHEILVCLILLSNGQWYERLDLIFDVFQAHGAEELTYDDILMLSQISAVTLYKLWMTETSWIQSELNTLTEGIADGVYAKLEKELDQGITKFEFVSWAQERFKSSRSIATPESLVQIMTSQYE